MSRLTKFVRGIRAAQAKGPEEAEFLKELSALDFDSMRRRYAGSKHGKFLDFEWQVRRNVSICRTLGLIGSPRQRVLDIGCGAGLLLYMLQRLGHEAVGTDIEHQFYGEMASLYGVDRRINPVRPFQPLSIDGEFDAVTAVAIEFDKRRGDGRIGYWGVGEWSYFLPDVAKHLTHSGRLLLWLNKPADADYYDQTVYSVFCDIGRKLSRSQFLMNRAEIERAAEALRDTKPPADGTSQPAPSNKVRAGK